MLDSSDLMKIFKKAAIEAVKAEKPTEVTYGKVVSAEPLAVEVDAKITLGPKQLAMGETMQEYEAEVEMEVEELELELELVLDKEITAAVAKGNGKMKGKLKLRRSLDVGTEVILVRQQGGQKYMIQDKVKKNDA